MAMEQIIFTDLDGTLLNHYDYSFEEAKEAIEYIKISKSQSYLEIRIFFKHIKKQFPLKGFGDMSVENVRELTGLSEESAKHSMRRNFTEPFIFEGVVDLKLLKDEAEKEGLEIVKGGRFYHVISQGQGKAKAMMHLTHLYEEYFEKKFTTIALDDSENDFSMLQAADVGVLIPWPNGEFADINTENIIKATYPGSKGCNKALLEILDAS
ncbi:MAG: hypothetical protein AUK54_03135 [Helicobacteraceae bacterium CG2_30_36_10]|nr:MAG: hypothetical protein AUK54_03135 [Helicobacteraceae bacterium CG2_30_36_10]